MVTEPTVAAMPATRSRIPQLPRLLWLGALLFGLLYTHGLHSEGVAAHVSPGIVAAVPSDGPGLSAADESHDGGHDSTRPDQDCAPGQPTDAVDVPPPAASPLEVTLPNHGSAHSVAASTVAAPSDGPCATPAILRI